MEKLNQQINEMAKTVESVNKDVQKSLDEYIALGVKTQDELFKLALNQANSIREYTEFALRSQSELITQLEKSAKANRQIWMDGLKKWRENVEDTTKAAVASVTPTKK